MRIGLAQIRCSVGDIPANCAQYRGYAQRASEQGCDVLLFPEMSDTGYVATVMRDKASAWSDLPFLTLQECAERYGLYVVAGISERVDEGIYNALAVISPEGALMGKYRKTHLFPLPPGYENEVFRPGASFTVLTVGELVWGFSICYDLRFPEMYRTLALQGAEVLAVCSAWPARRQAHWDILTRARAIENQAYLVAVNRIGTDSESRFGGHSRIVDPWGQIVHQGAEEEVLLVGEIDREQVTSARTSIPVFGGRRPELYGDLQREPRP